MTQNPEPLALMGAPGSPYTRKMLALLRYRHIPHQILWGGHQNPPPGLPSPKVKLLPTFYFPDGAGGVEAVVDSTPIARRLETMHAARSAIPSDPALAFLNFLVEDFADEWLTKAMFHYRWRHKADRENAGPLLVFWSMPLASPEAGAAAAVMVTKRQFDRLFVVGSNDVTAETIETSYARFVAVLDDLIARRGYVLGARPSTADFAIHGQLTQLGVIEPTPAAITARHPRVRAWIDRVEPLSGLAPSGGDWFSRSEATEALTPLLTEIGRVYAPFLVANAHAVAEGDDAFETLIDSRAWAQPTFPYQAKCLAQIREAFAALGTPDAGFVRELLDATGCAALASGA